MLKRTVGKLRLLCFGAAVLLSLAVACQSSSTPAATPAPTSTPTSPREKLSSLRYNSLSLRRASMEAEQ